MSNPADQNFVEVPPGRKCTVGYVYQVLQPMAEGSGQSGGPTDPPGNVGGL